MTTSKPLKTAPSPDTSPELSTAMRLGEIEKMAKGVLRSVLDRREARHILSIDLPWLISELRRVTKERDFLKSARSDVQHSQDLANELDWYVERYGTREKIVAKEEESNRSWDEIKAMTEAEVTAALDAEGVDMAGSFERFRHLTRALSQRNEARAERDTLSVQVAELKNTLAAEHGEASGALPGWTWNLDVQMWLLRDGPHRQAWMSLRPDGRWYWYTEPDNAAHKHGKTKWARKAMHAAETALAKPEPA